MSSSGAYELAFPVACATPTPVQSSPAALSPEQLNAALRDIQTDLLNTCNQVPSLRASPINDELDRLSARLSALVPLENNGWVSVMAEETAQTFVKDTVTLFFHDFAVFLSDLINYLRWSDTAVRDRRLLSFRASATTEEVPEQCTPMWISLREIEEQFLVICHTPVPSQPAFFLDRFQFPETCRAILIKLESLTGLKVDPEGPKVIGAIPSHRTELVFKDESCEALLYANHIYYHALFRYYSLKFDLSLAIGAVPPTSETAQKRTCPFSRCFMS